jgi:hypothetical protein
VRDALARAAAWLVEPTVGSCGPVSTQTAERGTELRLVPPQPTERLLVAVVGLAPGCGATTLARGLAATLARRDHAGAAIVASNHEPSGPNLSTPAATRLALRMNGSAAGRLCLTGTDDVHSLQRLAPTVLDLPGSNAVAAVGTHLTILVAPGDAEPALAELAARTLNALTVVTRADNPSRWDGRAFHVLPHSRLGARLAAAGWEPRGALRAAIERLADACEEAACP